MADEKSKPRLLFESLTTAHLPRMPSSETASATTAHLTVALGVPAADPVSTPAPVQAVPAPPTADGAAKTDD